MSSNGLPLTKRIGQTVWFLLLLPFLLLFGLLFSIGHAGKRSGYSDE